MKKSKYIALAAAFALTACTNTDEFGDTSVPSGSISFSAPFVKKATTRATGDIDGTTLKSQTIKVWAEAYDTDYATDTKTLVLDGDNPKHQLTCKGDVWSYQEPQYWESGKT